MHESWSPITQTRLAWVNMFTVSWGHDPLGTWVSSCVQLDCHKAVVCDEPRTRRQRRSFQTPETESNRESNRRKAQPQASSDPFWEMDPRAGEPEPLSNSCHFPLALVAAANARPALPHLTLNSKPYITYPFYNTLFLNPKTLKP